MEAFAQEAVSRRPQTFIVDTTDFQHIWGDGMIPWHNALIVPRYYRAGVAKSELSRADRRIRHRTRF